MGHQLVGQAGERLGPEEGRSETVWFKEIKHSLGLYDPICSSFPVFFAIMIYAKRGFAEAPNFSIDYQILLLRSHFIR